jgi:transcriptional regulator with XRE-family HTH domain
MSHVGERISRARKGKGLSQAALGRMVNVAQTTVSSWEVARTEPSREEVARVAAALEVPLADLELGDGEHWSAPRPRGLPLVGRVGAGGEGLYADDYALGAADEYVEPVPGMPMDEEIIVVEIDGDSMAPAVMDGDLAFFGPVRHDLDNLINKRVMARLADGRKFFKILKRGSRRGVWTLRSLNPATPDIEDVQLTWVLPYRGSRPR